MGFHNRDYARDNWRPRDANARRRGSGFSSWEIWKKIVAINVVVFLLQIFITRPASESDIRKMPFYADELRYQTEMIEEYESAIDESYPEQQVAENESTPGDVPRELKEGNDWIALEKKREHERKMMEQVRLFMPRVSLVQQWFQLDSDKLRQGQIWRLVTAGFCHDRMSIFHLLINMLFLFWFGSRLEMKLGSAEFAAFYFSALLASGLTYVAVDMYSGVNIPAIGASGAVWGVVAVYALLFPYERIYVYFLFPVEIRFLVLVYFLFDLHPVLLTLSGDGSMFGGGVAHAAHIGGAIFGFLYWYNQWELLPIWDRLRSGVASLAPQAKIRGDDSPSISVHDPRASEDAEMQMDRILEKISRDGRDSLTDEELETLERSSRAMRGRRK